MNSLSLSVQIPPKYKKKKEKRLIPSFRLFPSTNPHARFSNQNKSTPHTTSAKTHTVSLFLMSSLPPPLWPPPPPPDSFTPVIPQPAQPLAAAVPPPSSLSLSPSLLIIAAIIVFVFLASISIHLLLRLLSTRSPSRVVSSYSFSAASTADIHFPNSPPHAQAPTTPNSDHSKTEALIEALPIFTLASSLASIPKSSPDCAVCLSPFDPKAELRLLPACRHAFHAECIDTWLRSTASCPLCRASVRLPFPPLPASSGNDRSRSFRVEIGSVSRRRNDENPNNVTSGRSYSLGSFDYLVEEEDIEAVVSRISRMKEDQKEAEMATGAPAPPGEHMAELAGEGRGWLRDYVDRIASSASSSFNSLRFSGRWSHRPENGVPSGESRRWDVEAAALQSPATGDEATFYAIYRWIAGV